MRFSLTMVGLALATLLAGTVVSTAQAADPSLLTISAGGWEVLRGKHTEPELDIDYRSSYRLWIFKPHFGALVAGDGDYYGYGGLLTDIYWGPHIVTTLSTAVGFYGGGGFDLGSHVEFRSGGDIAYRFDNAARLGVAFYHISNAGITQRNPGSESALMTFSYPIGKLFGTSAKASSPVPTVASTQFSTPAPVRN
jgi:hypothetical protein